MEKVRCDVQIGRVMTNRATDDGGPEQYVRLRLQFDGGGMVDVDLSLEEFALAITNMGVRTEATLRGVMRPVDKGVR